MLALIGDQFHIDDNVCGCVLSVRAQEDIISVWNQDDSDAEAKARIKCVELNDWEITTLTVVVLGIRSRDA